MLLTTPNFHVHPLTGNPGRCRAHLHECPFSPQDQHFETQEEARSFYEDFARRLRDPRESVRFHFVTDEEEIHFTEGDCGLLARALHRKTGWPLVALSERRASDLEKLDWAHMAVRSPDGRYLDTSGLSTAQDFLQTWKDWPRVTEFPLQEWVRMHPDGPQYSSSPVKVANRIASVLASLGVLAQDGQKSSS